MSDNSKKFKEIIEKNTVVLPTFSLKDIILLPGISRIFRLEKEEWKSLIKKILGTQSEKEISAVNIAEINGGYGKFGTICVLKIAKDEPQNGAELKIKALALGITEIKSITAKAMAEINPLPPFDLTDAEWKSLTDKKTFKEITDKILKEIKYVFSSQEKINEKFLKKELIVKSYSSYIDWLNAILDYLMEFSRSRPLLEKILNYLKLADPQKHKEVFSSGLKERFRLDNEWLFKNTTPAERQIIFASRIIIRELQIIKEVGKKIEEAAEEESKKEEIFDAIDINRELIRRSFENLLEIQKQARDPRLANIIKEAIDESLGELRGKALSKPEEGPKCIIKEYEERLKKIINFLSSPDDEKFIKNEINSLRNLFPGHAEYEKTINYLDFLFGLPWGITTKDAENFNEVSGVFDEDHFGLEKPKQRIIEHLAAGKLNPDKKGPILCFIGPPGVGKTSLGKSIARALGRKFIRISLGGIRDEAVIRGHRKTYVGAKAGRILEEISKCGSSNPVFMIDELDKLTKDYQGDPASALLEVLDPEQNFSFNDSYLGIGFNLSRVIFIATANIADTIPSALFDRIGIIKIHGYTEPEKSQIAQKFLIPKVIKENGLSAELAILFSPNLVKKIIREYTRESGVRELERNIDAIARKLAVKIVSGETLPEKISSSKISEYLGVAPYRESSVQIHKFGHIIGLAYTPAGGNVLSIEASKRKKGNEASKITITGSTGEDIKESAKVAVSLINSDEYIKLLKTEDAEKFHLHIHIPPLAVEKDGPSAGLTILMALISEIREEKAEFIAMTGEIDLKGGIFQIGGLKEKLLAAARHGIKKVLIPKENLPELSETPKQITEELEIIPVSIIEEALPHVFPKLFPLPS